MPAACRILCSNVRGLAGNLSDLTMASSQYDILLSSETLVSDMRYMSELLVHSPHKWWSTLKSAVLGTSSSLPPHVSEGHGLVCESVGKADLLSDHFDSKQAREAVDLPLTFHPSPSLTTFVFWSSEVWCLLLDFDPYRGIDPMGMFPLFLKNC